MPVKTEAVGKEYPAVVYAVGREKVREYASAVGESDPIHHDVEAARAAGFPDVVAPPMFAVVYCWAAIGSPAVDPEVGMNLAMLVHGGQEFAWERPVVAGDEISTAAKVADVHERNGMGFYVFETLSRDRDGEVVCTGTWTNIVRGV